MIGIVNAPLGEINNLYPALRQRIRLTENFCDPDLPDEVQTALRGMEVSGVFFGESLMEEVAEVAEFPGVVATVYATEVQENLATVGKTREATMLGEKIQTPVDMLLLTSEMFELIYPS
ncbi:MAG: hypothetical protein WC805_00875 [Patescibacteria group bacterium]|jgi:hypothetical protein